MKASFFTNIFNKFLFFLKKKKIEQIKEVQIPVIQEPKIQQKQQQKQQQPQFKKLHFIFVTRCYKPTNLITIKNNLKQMFSNQDKCTYQQIIIIDLTHNQKGDEFQDLRDQHTSLYFISIKNKNDEYIAEAMDKSLNMLDKEGYVYILDDDNLINESFLNICNDANYQTDDVIFFNIEGSWDWEQQGTALGHVDWSSFVTKLSVIKQLKIYNKDAISSSNCDGMFFDKVIKSKYKIKKINSVDYRYNALPKP